MVVHFKIVVQYQNHFALKSSNIISSSFSNFKWYFSCLIFFRQRKIYSRYMEDSKMLFQVCVSCMSPYSIFMKKNLKSICAKNVNFLVRFLFSNQLCRFSSLDSKVERAKKWIKSLWRHIWHDFEPKFQIVFCLRAARALPIKKSGGTGTNGHCPLRKVVARAGAVLGF